MPALPDERDSFEPVAAEVAAALGLQLIAPAGGGAFKRVFRAHAGAEDVALKIVTRPGVSLRTTREIDAAQRCAHPGVCRLLGFGVCSTTRGDLAYLVEEFLPGGSLEDRLMHSETIGDAEVLAVAPVLADAVVHMKTRGLVHRDIKPANIMFRDAGWGGAVIVDFGLVRDLSAVSLTQTWLDRGPGTPYYAAPEQLNNEKALIGWRADQFSFAVTLSVARFGRHPYQDAGESLYAQTTVERVAARLNPAPWFSASVSSSPLAAIARSAQPWPHQRYCRPADFLRAWNP